MGTFVAGYSLVWFALVLYVARTSRRQRRLEQQYEALCRQLAAEDSPEAPISRAA